MPDAGEITGREIAPNRDAERNTMLLQTVETDDDDVQTVERNTLPGFDVNPEDGCRVFSVEIGKNWKVSFAFDDGSEPDSTLGQGELEIYSLQDGTRKAKIRLGVDESISVEGASVKLLSDADNAVRFSKLKEAFDELRNDHNALASKHNTHTHITTATVLVGAPGVISPTTATQDPSSASVGQAKIEEITVP